MALDIRIQQATQSYRETVAGYNEATVRGIAEDLGVDGHETTPLVTLREEIVQSWRDDARAAAYPAPVTMSGPGAIGEDEESSAGNPGNDATTLIDVYDT